MKKSLKAIIALCLVVVLAGTIFAACSAKPQENKVYKIGVVQADEHVALNAATQGFIDVLYEAFGQDNVDIDVQKAFGDTAANATIVNQYVSKGVDLIMANATPSLQAAATATDQIPIVATCITEYGVALGMEGFSGKTGINVTGTSDLPPLDRQAAMITEIMPNVKTVGIIYCSAELNSVYQADEIERFLTEAGVKVTRYMFVDSNDLPAIVEQAVNANEALYIPTDNTAASNTGIIDNIARPAGVPVFAGEEGICKGCGIVTLSIDYYDIGKAAGEMAVEILKDGKDPAEMEIRYAPEFVEEYNAEICKELGITVPDSYTAIPAE